MSYQIRRIVLPTMLFITIILLACQGGKEAEWVGTVTVLMLEGSTDYDKSTVFRSVVVLTTPEKNQYALLTSPEVELVGIEKSSNSIIWKLGKKYQVMGRLLTDKAEVAAAESVDLMGPILASRVELLPDQEE